DGIRDRNVTGVQTCALPILLPLFRAIIELNPEEYGEYENDGPVQVWYKIYHAVTDSVVPDEMGVEYRDGYLSVPESLTAEYGARSEERRVGREGRRRRAAWG